MSQPEWERARRKNLLCKFACRRGIVTLYKARKEGCVMNRSTKNMAKGAALGVMAGTAVGAIGAYAAQKSPKEWKKTMKKAAHTAEKALDSVDKMLQSF